MESREDRPTRIRRYSTRAFPPYSYVPGRFPHPLSDPAGHSFGQSHAPTLPLEPEHYHNSPEYLFAIDLFNHGYYWESHEVWERLWHAAGRTGPVAWLLQGLIKLAAAGVKIREGKRLGTESHSQGAKRLFERVRHATQQDIFVGLRLSKLLRACEVAQSLASDHCHNAEAVQIVFPFELKLNDEA